MSRSPPQIGMCVLKKPTLHPSLHSEQVRTCSGRTISEACRLGVGPKNGELRSHSYETKQEAFVSVELKILPIHVIKLFLILNKQIKRRRKWNAHYLACLFSVCFYFFGACSQLCCEGQARFQIQVCHLVAAASHEKSKIDCSLNHD